MHDQASGPPTHDPPLAKQAIAPPLTRRAPWRVLLRATFVVWVLACVLGGAYMLSAHLLTLPKPELTDLGFQRSAVVEHKPGQEGRWLAVHTRHEYTDVSLPGYTSRPEQYYGSCAIER